MGCRGEALSEWREGESLEGAEPLGARGAPRRHARPARLPDRTDGAGLRPQLLLQRRELGLPLLQPPVPLDLRAVIFAAVRRMLDRLSCQGVTYCWTRARVSMENRSSSGKSTLAGSPEFLEVSSRISI